MPWAVVAVVGVALLPGTAAASTSDDGTVAGYVRLADQRAIGGPVLAGDDVLVGSVRRSRARLTAYSLTGVRRDLPLPGAELSVSELAASSQALAVMTSTARLNSASQRRVPAGFGAPAGPLRPFPAYPLDVAVAGSVVLSLEERRGRSAPRLVARDLAGDAAPRRLPLPGSGLTIQAAGGFVAVIGGFDGRTAIVVIDVRTGSELYRVPAAVQGWGLGPDGRLVLLEPTRGDLHRIVTATPDDPRRRTIARVRLYAPRVAVSPASFALVRRRPGGLGQVVLMDPTGARRAITPPLNHVNELSFDGRVLAFTAGRCVFAGPVPAGAPEPAPRNRCFDAPAQLDFVRLDEIAQRRGRSVRVPLRCEAPPKAHCVTLVRLSGRGFRVHRRARIPPGLHEVRVRIPRSRRATAWREGMTLETRHGRSGSGATLPS